MSQLKDLSLGRQIAYATGQLGWSTLINIIGIQLVYFYIPPENAGLPYFITQVTFLAVLNAVTLIAATGRLFDAITDPLIASFSDRLKSRWGRRIPFLAAGAIPAAVFTLLMFMPPSQEISSGNLVWLIAMQFLFYLFLTVYVTPYFALLPELGHTPDQKLNLSTYISITYALGIIIAAQTPMLANMIKSSQGLTTVESFQYAVGVLAGFATLMMLVPVFFIKEKDYCRAEPTSVNMREALLRTFKNKNFRYYVAADFAYFAALSIIMTGLLYYMTVLLFPEDKTHGENLVGALLAVMVVVSFVFYPIVNLLAKKFGKKNLVLFAFVWFGMVFMLVYFLGKLPMGKDAQAYLLIILASVPMSILGILPNAILADIAEHDALKSGVRQEGMYFAARTLMQKMGQSFGILVFAALTTFGKDPGDSLGIQLSGIVGLFLAVAATFVFRNYREKQILQETKELSG